MSIIANYGPVYNDADWNSPTILLEEGMFRISQFTHRLREAPSSSCIIEHRCAALRSPSFWHPFTYNHTGVTVYCACCQEPIPDGLYAMFWFLKEQE